MSILCPDAIEGQLMLVTLASFNEQLPHDHYRDVMMLGTLWKYTTEYFARFVNYSR
jgi:hypothetical protein